MSTSWLRVGSVNQYCSIYMYIFGMFSLSEKGNIIDFADHTAIFYEAINYDSLKDEVET